MKIFIVIPFYNEEKHIIKVAKEVSDYKLPLILVNDGSRDNSQLLIKKLKLKNLTVLTHKVNLGKGAAMKTGAEYAFKTGAEAVIFMDGDNQHNPKDITKFVKILESGKFDVIFGSRNGKKGTPFIRYMGNKIASVVLLILFGIHTTDVLCGFKSVTRKAYKKICWDSTGYGVETEMVARAGKNKIKVCDVPVSSIYHDTNKGVTILDGIGIMFEIVKWRLTI